MESFDDPKPWSDEELADMKTDSPVSQTEVERIIGEIPPITKRDMEDDVGQRLAALRYEVNAMDSLQVDGLEDAAELLAGLREEYKALASVIRSWERVVGGLMADKKETVKGVGTLERSRDKSRRNWQHEDLLRVVLDSDRRPKGDVADGEVESDLDVLRDVYGLRGYNAGITKLRGRGIDPDEYAEVEDRGWTVRIT